MKNHERPRYSENAPQYWWMLLFMRLLAVGFVLLFAQLAMAQEEGWLAMLLAAFLISVATISFSAMRYELTDGGVVAWLWPFSSRTAYKDIERVELGRIPWYAGLGMHLFLGSLFVNSVYGKAVVIHRSSGWSRRLFLTPKDPEGFKRLLEQHLLHAGKAKKGH